MTQQLRIVAIAIACLTAQSVDGQVPTPAGVTNGSRVRVTTNGSESRGHTGSVLRISNDSLVLVDTIYSRSVTAPASSEPVSITRAFARSR